MHDGERALDLTGEVCPMTTVRTRLALDRLGPGDRLHVLLRGEEATRSVPAAIGSLGHEILSLEPPDDAGVTRLLVRKAGARVA